MQFRYDKMHLRSYCNRTDRQIYDACNVDQVIEKLSQPLMRRKTSYTKMVDRTLKKHGRPVCTGYGMKNPIKLNLSNLNLKGLANNS